MPMDEKALKKLWSGTRLCRRAGMVLVADVAVVSQMAAKPDL
jgi:hypothetical protein